MPSALHSVAPGNGWRRTAGAPGVHRNAFAKPDSISYPATCPDSLIAVASAKLPLPVPGISYMTPGDVQRKARHAALTWALPTTWPALLIALAQAAPFDGAP